MLQHHISRLAHQVSTNNISAQLMCAQKVCCDVGVQASSVLLTLKRWYLAWTVMTGHGTPFTMLMSPNRLSWCSAAATVKQQVRRQWQI